jgi:hypothetical protein
MNPWLFGAGFFDGVGSHPFVYLNESQIEHPSLMPVVADGVHPDPDVSENCLPPLNIYAGFEFTEFTHLQASLNPG